MSENPFYGETFAERQAIREASQKSKPAAKAVKDDDAEVEDKAVKSAESKAPAKKSAPKKS